MSSDDATAPASPEFYLDQALAVFEQARELTDPEERPDFLGVILHDLAEVYEATGRVAEAVDLYRSSVAAKRRGSEPGDLSFTQLALASRLIDRAEFDEARTLVEEAGDLLALPVPDLTESQRADKIYMLGLLHERLGDAGDEGAHRVALRTLERALSLYDEDLELNACAGTLRSIGRVQRLLGRDEDASMSLAAAARCYERDGNREAQIVVLIDLGRLYQRLADLSATRTLAERVPRPREPADVVAGGDPTPQSVVPVPPSVDSTATGVPTSDPFDVVPDGDRDQDVDEVPDVATALGLTGSGEATR